MEWVVGHRDGYQTAVEGIEGDRGNPVRCLHVLLFNGVWGQARGGIIIRRSVGRRAGNRGILHSFMNRVRNPESALAIPIYHLPPLTAGEILWETLFYS